MRAAWVGESKSVRCDRYDQPIDRQRKRHQQDRHLKTQKKRRNFDVEQRHRGNAAAAAGERILHRV